MNFYENTSQYQQQPQQQAQINQPPITGFNDFSLRRGINEFSVQQRAYNELPLNIHSNNFQSNNSNNLQRNFYDSRLSAPNQISNQANFQSYSMNNLSAPVVPQAPLPVAPIPMQTNQQLPFRPQTSRVMVVSRNAENNDLEVTAKKLEKFRVIQNGEREVFRDGTAIIRVYKYCTCCRSRFLRKCPTFNFIVWFYSLPCWFWFLFFLLLAGFLGAITFLVTQLPKFKTYYKYEHKVQYVDDYKFVVTDPSCVGITCTTLSNYRVIYAEIVNLSTSHQSSTCFWTSFISILICFIYKLVQF